MVHIVIPILPGTDSHMIKVKHANGLVRRQHRSNDVPAMRGDIVYTQDEVDLTRSCSVITCLWAVFRDNVKVHLAHCYFDKTKRLRASLWRQHRGNAWA